MASKKDNETSQRGRFDDPEDFPHRVELKNVTVTTVNSLREIQSGEPCFVLPTLDPMFSLVVGHYQKQINGLVGARDMHDGLDYLRAIHHATNRQPGPTPHAFLKTYDLMFAKEREANSQPPSLLSRIALSPDSNFVPAYAPTAEEPEQPATERKHGHYHKELPTTGVDVYRVLLAFGVTDPCLQHAVKKLLVAGGRGAGKDIHQDVQETIDTLARWQEMRSEENNDF